MFFAFFLTSRILREKKTCKIYLHISRVHNIDTVSCLNDLLYHRQNKTSKQEEQMLSWFSVVRVRSVYNVWQRQTVLPHVNRFINSKVVETSHAATCQSDASIKVSKEAPSISSFPSDQLFHLALSPCLSPHLHCLSSSPRRPSDRHLTQPSQIKAESSEA